MAVEAALIDQIRCRAAEMPSDGEPPIFESMAEVFGFVIASVRADGSMAEDDAVEALARAARLTQSDLRKIVGVLGPLGYTVACARLKQLARKKSCC